MKFKSIFMKQKTTLFMAGVFGSVLFVEENSLLEIKNQILKTSTGMGNVYELWPVSGK